MSNTASNAFESMPDDVDAKFKIIQEFAPALLWISDASQHFTWFNKYWWHFSGLQPQPDLLGAWMKCVHPDDLNKSVDIYKKAFESRQAFTREYRLRRHDGQYLWVADSAVPAFSDEQVFTGFIGHCVVIQDIKKLTSAHSQETKSLTELYESLLSATPDFIYSFNFAEPEPQFSYVNAGLIQMFGKPVDQIIGKTFREIGYEDWHADMHNQEIATVRSTKKSIRGEVAFTGTFGRRIYDYIFTPVFDAHGEVVAVAGTTRDVTERHNTQEKLKQNEQALQEADSRKDEFLAMLAHELRNPLSPISAATKILAISNYDEAKVRSSAQIIERQVKHMVELVDDLLDVSRVTRGLVNIEKLPQDMGAIIASAIEQVRPLIDSKHHELIIESTSKPAKVFGDHKRLVQIVANLLNNSAKYTADNGQIKLTMKIERGDVVISVSDNGIGILASDQTSIFELFAQAKRSSDRSQGGLGIGLALVKSLLELHDGSISCNSAGIGLGSQFTITLPLWIDQRSVEREEKTVSSETHPNVTVLVVDDNVDAASSLGDLIELYGHEVIVENDPLRALDTIALRYPKICILDIGLPNMDGYELAKRIRKNPLMAGVTLIAVTGYGQENDIKRAFVAGFNHHVVKPVDCDLLMELVNNAASNKPS